MKKVQSNMIAKENELVDIQYVVINKDLPQEEKIKDYLNQIKNPYRFLCQEVVVELEYGKEGYPLTIV